MCYNGLGDIKMVLEIVERLKEKKLTIAAMESCTGGGLANALTNIEGASDVISFSAVTYSNAYKVKMGVNSKTIDKYSVYSFEVSDEMSFNISNFAGSDIGVGITGKLNRADKNNLYGKDNIVYISVYDRKTKKYYHKMVEATRASRALNKDLVIENVCEVIDEVLNNLET